MLNKQRVYEKRCFWRMVISTPLTKLLSFLELIRFCLARYRRIGRSNKPYAPRKRRRPSQVSCSDEPRRSVGRSRKRCNRTADHSVTFELNNDIVLRLP